VPEKKEISVSVALSVKCSDWSRDLIRIRIIRRKMVDTRHVEPRRLIIEPAALQNSDRSPELVDVLRTLTEGAYILPG